MPPKRVDKSLISAPTPTTPTTAYKFQLPALDIPHASLAEGTSIPPPQPSPPPSPPQTPLSTSSPNPLRSHPTSSHSLARQFSGEVLSSTRGNTNGKTSPAAASSMRGGGTTVKANTTPAYGTMSPPPTTQHTTAKRSHTQASTMTTPPSKRPHIRKLLSLRSLTGGSSNRSSTDLPSHPPPRSESRADSIAPSTITSATASPSLKKRKSGAFWRRRDSIMGFNLGFVGEENTAPGGGDVVMGNTAEAEAMVRKGTPPPTLPEFDSLGGGVVTKADTDSQAGKQAREAEENETKRIASGWFGGGEMFEGIGRR